MESNQTTESVQGARVRRVSRVASTPPAAPGFIGAGHTAVEVLAPDDLAGSDPFVLLMDDRLDIPNRRVIGGAHPHAGIETVTLVLEGALHDRDEGELGAGDVIWMTAGRGIVHNEAVEAVGKSRILQLWIALPERDRDLAPRFEIVRKHTAPLVRGTGVSARLYSGASGALRSSTLNRVPITMLDVALAPGATFLQQLPGTYNGFAYVVEGSVRIGDAQANAGQVAWLPPSTTDRLVISAGDQAARLVLYAGEPIREPLVHYGPFVAGSMDEIAGFYHRFRAGQFASMHDLALGHREQLQRSQP